MNRDFVAALLLLFLVVPAEASESVDPYLEQAKDVLRRAPIFDGHNDLPYVIREKHDGDVEGFDISVIAEGDTDIPRLRQGMVGAQFWSVYVSSSATPIQAVTQQLEQIDLAHQLIDGYPDDFVLALRAADVEAAQKEGRIASLIGIEGGHTIVNSLGVLRSYYKLGVRYMTLTHFHSNDWADSATGEARNNGLSTFGEDVIGEMNSLGMIVDLSHVSAETMRDVLDITKAPVIFSHSAARALIDHPRNVPDDVLEMVTRNRGIVMVPFVPPFVNEARRVYNEGLIPLYVNAKEGADLDLIAAAYIEKNGPPPVARLAEVADHIEHVAAVSGQDHVAIGSDFFGASKDELVLGLEDVSTYPKLIAELLRRGWSEDEIERLTYRNMLRVLTDVEAVSKSLTAEDG